MIGLGYLLTFGYIFLVLLATTFTEKFCSMNKEFSRKVVHIGVSFAWVIMYHFFGISWHLVVPPFLFIILNYISYQRGIFSVMERDQKGTLGTVYYAVSMFLLALITNFHQEFIVCYAIGFFTMALGDGIAPLIGNTISSYTFSNGKTLFGSLTVCFITIVVSYVALVLFQYPTPFFLLVLLGSFGMGLEYIGKKGFDNLTVPLGVALASYVLMVVYGFIG